jgi:hypothetical protein
VRSIEMEQQQQQQQQQQPKPGSKEGICVGIRMRPLNERELSSGQQSIFKCLPNSNAISQFTKDSTPVEGQCYNYDKVFDEKSSTEAVYEYTGKDIVAGVANGINGTVFACKLLL